MISLHNGSRGGPRGRPTRATISPRSARRRWGCIRRCGRRRSGRGMWRRCHSAAAPANGIRRSGAWASRGLRGAIIHSVRDRRNDDDDRDDHCSDSAGTPVAAWRRITGPSGSSHPGIGIRIWIRHFRAPRVAAGQDNAPAQAPFLGSRGR